MKQHFSREQASRFIEYVPERGTFIRKRFSRGGRAEFSGRVDHKGYLRTQVCGFPVLCHRLAWLMHYGEWPDGEIDHVNGNRQDNRITNLRVCSHPQNNHNQPLRRTNTSGVKGVHFNKKAKKWHAQICLNYKIHHVGLFDELCDAEAAIKAFREELHGEFANHG